MELYSKLIAKIMGVVYKVVAGFLHGVVERPFPILFLYCSMQKSIPRSACFPFSV